MAGLGWLNPVADALGAVGSIWGALSAENDRRAAIAAQQAAIRAYQTANDQQYLNALQSGGASLYGLAGTGADALRQLGSSMGGALAAGGVYNPTSVSGALSLAQQRTNAGIADIASRNLENAANIRAQGLGNVANLQYGLGLQQYNQANQNVGNAVSGLGSFLGALTQQNLTREGVNKDRTGQPLMNGTVNQGANLPGNAGNPSGSTAGGVQIPPVNRGKAIAYPQGYGAGVVGATSPTYQAAMGGYGGGSMTAQAALGRTRSLYPWERSQYPVMQLRGR